MMTLLTFWHSAAGPGSGAFHEGQQVPEDSEVDVIVRHLLVHLLDALPDLFPRRIVGLEDLAAVEAESCPDPADHRGPLRPPPQLDTGNGSAALTIPSASLSGRTLETWTVPAR